MKNFKVSKKLMVSFGIVLALFLAVILLTAVSLNSVSGKLAVFYNGPFKNVQRTDTIDTKMQEVAKNMLHAALTKDAAETEKRLNMAEQAFEAMDENVEYLKINFNGEKSDLEAIEQNIESIRRQFSEYKKLSNANDIEGAFAVYENEILPILASTSTNILNMKATSDKVAQSSFESGRTTGIYSTILSVAVGIISAAVCIWLALYLTKSLTRPISEIENAAKEMAAGSLNVSITYESQDEMGSLSASMRTLCENMKAIIADIGKILAALADGDFHITSSCLKLYKGDYVPILEAMRLIRDNLNKAMTLINQSAEQVALGSTQMAESAQSLAEGATEQAGAVEELTATVENVSSMAEVSANSAQEAYEKVRAAQAEAAKSQESLQELTAAMDRISETSKEIQNIITSIEDIASQTNLLSLNASIEAARAGEAGKGFAVVADQIGKLASDSAQSAVDTRELIAKSLEEIQSGNNITEITVEAIRSVLASMQVFADIVKESSETSIDQAQLLKQVEEGIEQISRVVQSNSAAAEETSATSEELSAQAEGLKDQVGRFKLLDS